MQAGERPELAKTDARRGEAGTRMRQNRGGQGGKHRASPSPLPGEITALAIEGLTHPLRKKLTNARGKPRLGSADRKGMGAYPRKVGFRGGLPGLRKVDRDCAATPVRD